MTSAPARLPQISSCSMAPARNVSPAASSTFLPSCPNRCASFPMVVVLPTPLTPTTRTTHGDSEYRRAPMPPVSFNRLASSRRNNAAPSPLPARYESRTVSSNLWVACTPKSAPRSNSSNASHSSSDPAASARALSRRPVNAALVRDKPCLRRARSPAFWFMGT